MSETNNKSLAEYLLDVTLYLPIGILQVLEDQIPKLIDRGETVVTNRISNARIIGEFAFNMGEKQLKEVGAYLSKQLQDRVESRLGVAKPGKSANSTSSFDTNLTEAKTTPSSAKSAKQKKPTSTSSVNPTVPTPDLHIPDYNELSASQVVRRLSGLSIEELKVVYDYEIANRNRQTIINRIYQLTE
ncbi:MAG: hypothetical protein M1483_00625 [Actinobacteria bacterium]|nr:hypothetical protein [Actinomycetota bacterium]MCL6104138.1 hypothetical protein [Actinomycetota bacterium]